MAGGCHIREIDKSSYVRNRLTDFDEISHGVVYGVVYWRHLAITIVESLRATMRPFAKLL